MTTDTPRTVTMHFYECGNGSRIAYEFPAIVTQDYRYLFTREIPLEA